MMWCYVKLVVMCQMILLNRLLDDGQFCCESSDGNDVQYFIL